MKKATITQLKNELSEILEIVKNGEPVLVLDRNVPIVKMISAFSAAAGPDSDMARLAKLERSGHVRRGNENAFRKAVKTAVPVRTKKKVDAVRAVLDEREERD